MITQVRDKTHTSVAFLDCHVRAHDQELNCSYLASVSPFERCQLALAGLANLFLWLGWLHSSECFDLTWEDLMVIKPGVSATVNLPTGCGMVLATLLPKQNWLRVTIQTSQWPTLWVSSWKMVPPCMARQ
jgi:hypothetical protein